MATKKFHVYFGDIRINITLSGVMSERADVCVVPHYATGISLTGISAAFIHSMARNSIIEYQNYARDKVLKPNFAYVSACNGNNYRYLIHIPVLKRSTEKSKKIAKEDTFTGILSSLEGAQSVKAKTMVIPSINTGTTGVLSYEESGYETYRAIKTFIEKTPLTSLKEITIALKSQQALVAYLKSFATS